MACYTLNPAGGFTAAAAAPPLRWRTTATVTVPTAGPGGFG